jgi:hypothetical protein
VVGDCLLAERRALADEALHFGNPHLIERQRPEALPQVALDTEMSSAALRFRLARVASHSSQSWSKVRRGGAGERRPRRISSASAFIWFSCVAALRWSSKFFERSLPVASSQRARHFPSWAYGMVRILPGGQASCSCSSEPDQFRIGETRRVSRKLSRNEKREAPRTGGNLASSLQLRG